ncbi:DUF1707 domain-containing protein [Leifsonia sp. NPDC058230]|uniref:DUF1707 SHOCT-like domain-containing protein n=1 Tax=Leifsonia sp. NPDC058230 TaxID=3346391 RepID=UPI0036DDC55A
MTDFSDPSGATLRLSNAERDRAVAALQSHAGDGRLTDSELQTRMQSARVAVTRGDLAPLFADLPGFVDFDTPVTGTTPTAGAAYAPPTEPYAPQSYAPPAYGSQPDSRPQSSQPGRTVSRNGYIIVSITPFIALILFFLSSMLWGWAYSWLWFLLVPIVGVIVYGAGYGNDRDRGRDGRR